MSEGTVEFYLAGTSTPLTVYSDYGLTSSLGTTVSLNSAGYPVSGGGSVVSVYTGTSAYKIIVKDSRPSNAEGGPKAVMDTMEDAVRDLLKFEFFFPGRDDFERELRGELALMAPVGAGPLTLDSARALLDGSDLYVANLVLRPFVDAYLVVADRLAAAGDSAVNEADVLDEALRVGQQWELERRIASAESVSLELYKTALRLAAHRDLLAGDDAVGMDDASSTDRAAGKAGEPGPNGEHPAYQGVSLKARRAAFLAELQGVATQLDEIARIEATRRSTRGVR